MSGQKGVVRRPKPLFVAGDRVCVSTSHVMSFPGVWVVRGRAFSGCLWISRKPSDVNVFSVKIEHLRKDPA